MNHKIAIMYGIGIWVFVFIVAMLAFPLRAGERPFFESIMPVALVLATTIAAVFYFRTIKTRYVFIGMCLGIIWFVINLLLDACIFSWGPMKMSLMDYVKDIGVTYLLIPIIAIGFGYSLEDKIT